MSRTNTSKPLWLTVRMTEEEKRKLKTLLQDAAYCQTISELVRDILFHRKLTLNYRNESIEGLRVELGILRSELNKIGVNINQITNYFHLKSSAEGKRFFAKEILPHFKLLDSKMEQVARLIETLQIIQ